MTGQSLTTQKAPQFWGELDRRFRAPLLAYFFRRVQDRAEAEDLTQEVFLRLTRHADKPRGEGANAYVFMIAANLLTDRARLRASKCALAHRSLGFSNGDGIPDFVEDRNPERVLIGQETLHDVIGALAELAERTRDIFVLSHIENMQHRDIGALYGITVSAVEKHVMKALAHLGARFLGDP